MITTAILNFFIRLFKDFSSITVSPVSVYSVLNAVTGSLFAAFFDGIKPPISVSTMLNKIRITAGTAGSTAFTSFVPAR